MRRYTLNPKVKGIIAILISAIGFSFMSVFRLAGDLPVFQKIFSKKFGSHVYSIIFHNKI